MSDAPPPDKKVVQCNYRVATSACPRGARAYLTCGLDWTDARVKVLARSRSGRWVVRWESLKRLHNFRLKTLCPEGPVYAKAAVAGDLWTQETVDGLNGLAAEKEPA